MTFWKDAKMSVIDLSQKNAIGFGAILLRDILNKIYEEKSNGKSDVPVLVIIDEVHEFYGNSKTYEALKTLDAIARKGRSLGISVIFASQNLEDIPSGISKVVNSKIFFKGYSERNRNKSINDEALGPGYAISQIYGLSFVKLIKFPLPLGGLYEK
ncbi:zonular occludens toxin domain-containing protein [Acidiplasma cupricumulans]|uniref:zonular occludens toxin domain-containing protein n=1 Tax=Acidiplasma cupricumulans TaxID=312540 RepID=UPI000785E416|nr:zonular occludens toxin domain-containing protein [Acidiplasma cupricumulans]